MQDAIPITPDINLYFGTPFLVTQVPDAARVNAALLDRIAAVRASDPGVRLSNIGGWQSRPDLWEWGDPAMAVLRDAMHHAMLTIAALPTGETDLARVDVRYAIRASANVNRAGDYNVRHTHARYDWLLIYCVACGTPAPDRPLAGRVELHDPRRLADGSPLAAFGFGHSILIDPVPGRLVLCPAWLEHSVHPWQGTGEHVTVVAEVKITGGAMLTPDGTARA